MTFERVDPSQGEKERIAEAIRLLRRADLPMANDTEVSMMPAADMTNFRHTVKNTSLQLLYNFVDEPVAILYLISLHRIGGYGPRAA